MSAVALRLGHLAQDRVLQRSGVRWLKEDGQSCRAREIFAYCNIALAALGGATSADAPFAEEAHDLQVGFSSPVGGRLRRAERSSRGGFLDLLETAFLWDEASILGHLEPDGSAGAAAGDTLDLDLRLFAGRRSTPLADVRQGLLPGWYDRSRAWSAGIGADSPTLLSLGICEQMGVIRGEGGSFAELLDAADRPLHAVYMPENPLVPTARVLLDQRRGVVAADAIAADLSQAWRRLGAQATPQDWTFAGCLLAGLLGRPLEEGYDLMGRGGVFRSPPATAVLLSLQAEPIVLLRHKALGYHVHVHNYRIYEAGPASKEWLRTAFEPVRRTPQTIEADLAALATSLRREARQVLVMNMMSTSGFEDVFNYAPFDSPIGDTLGSFRAKELNLMLHDLARATGLRIIDCDAIASELGGEAHLPDGVHQSGAMQAAVREEIVRAVGEARVPAPEPAPVR